MDIIDYLESRKIKKNIVFVFNIVYLFLEI